MQDQSPVFSAGLLDRAAHLRPQSSALWAQGAAVVLPLWNKMPLMDRAGAMVLLPSAHPVLAGREQTALFLGLGPQDMPLFAVDLSDLVAIGDPEVASTGWSAEGVRCAELPEGQFRELRAVMAQVLPWEAEVAATARGILEWHARHGFCANCGQSSAMAEGGWRRDCPGCGAQHFPRTDPVVIMLVTHGNSVLLGRNANWPEGMYSLLAGFVEPGEPIEAAVRREVAEESGVRVGAVHYVASQPWPFPASLMFGCRAEALSTEITVDPAEIQDARWVSREDLSKAMVGLHPEIRPARRGAIAQFLMSKWLEDSWE
nr:NAD(+) diphosphatase [uncultured Celeribacter sp.]